MQSGETLLCRGVETSLLVKTGNYSEVEMVILELFLFMGTTKVAFILTIEY